MRPLKADIGPKLMNAFAHIDNIQQQIICVKKKTLDKVVLGVYDFLVKAMESLGAAPEDSVFYYKIN